MALDVKNMANGDTGNAENGKAVVLKARLGGIAGIAQVIESPGYSEFSIADFDTTPLVLNTRFDDPRYYSGDTAS